MNAIDKVVEIRCEGAGLLDIDDLTPFQGELKKLSHDNYNKLKNIILITWVQRTGDSLARR